MAALGGVAMMLMSKRKLSKEKGHYQQTGIDPSQLTGVQTSASSGGYQTIRGEAQVKVWKIIINIEVTTMKKNHRLKKRLKTNHQVKVVQCQKVLNQKNK